MQEDVANDGSAGGERFDKVSVFAKLADPVSRRAAKKVGRIIKLRGKDSSLATLAE